MDDALTPRQLQAKIADMIGDGLKKDWARERGITPSQLSDVLMGHRQPSRKLLDALGYERVVTTTILTDHIKGERKPWGKNHELIRKRIAPALA